MPRYLDDGEKAAANDRGYLLESHEDRLQKVESVVNDTRTEVAAASVRIEALGDQMESANSRMLDKMEDGFRRVFEKLDPISAQADALATRTNRNSEKIDRLDAKEKQRARRGKWILGTAAGLIIAGASAFASKSGEWLWTLLGR